MIPRKVRWRAAGFLPCLMRICFHHPLIVGLLQSSPVRSFTPNNLAGWRRHVSGLRQLLIAQSYHCFRGDLVCVFGPKLLNRLISKMRTRERKEKKKKARQIWLSGVWKPANFIRNEQKRKKMMEKDTFWWTAHIHQRPVQILEVFPSQKSLADTFIHTDEWQIKRKTSTLELCSEGIWWLCYAVEARINTWLFQLITFELRFCKKHLDV